MSEAFDVVFNQVLSFLQGAVFVIYCNNFFVPKLKKRANVFLCATFILLLYVSINIINLFFPVYSSLEILVNFAIMIPFSVLFHKGKIYLKVLMPIITFLLLMCITMVYTIFISVVFSKNINQIMIESTIYRYLYMAITNITFVLVLYVVFRVYKNKIDLKKPTDIISFFVIPLLTLIVAVLATAVISDTETSEWNRVCLGVIVLITFVIAFAMFSLMHRIGKSAEISAINSMMVKEQELYKTEIVNQSNYIEDISRVKHEMKNKLFCIRELLRSGRVKEAQKMCEDAESELSDVPAIFCTDNIYLNALLNMAYKKSVDNQVAFNYTIKTNLADIDESDLISLLGNLIDNAFEALHKLKSDKFLQITIFEKDNYYMCSVKNSILGSVIYRNPELETTKSDKRFHGHGLKIVKQIVKKYNGNISFSENDNVFDVSFMLERGKR